MKKYDTELPEMKLEAEKIQKEVEELQLESHLRPQPEARFSTWAKLGIELSPEIFRSAGGADQAARGFLRTAAWASARSGPSCRCWPSRRWAHHTRHIPSEGVVFRRTDPGNPPPSNLVHG